MKLSGDLKSLDYTKREYTIISWSQSADADPEYVGLLKKLSFISRWRGKVYNNEKYGDLALTDNDFFKYLTKDRNLDSHQVNRH